MGVGGAAGRLVELGERERRAQSEAARSLTLSDGDGGLECFLGGRRVRLVPLQQRFAADAVQFRFESAVSGTLARRQRFVDYGHRAVDVAGAGFGFGQRNFQHAVEEQDVLLAQQIDTATHVLESAPRRIAFSPRQALEKHSEGSPQRQIMLARKSGEFGGEFGRVPRDAREVAAHQFKHRPLGFPVRARLDMREPRDPRLRCVNEGSRPFDVAQRPQCERKVKHYRHAGVLSEVKGEIVVTRGLKQRERAFQMVACFDVFSGGPVGGPEDAMCDAGRGRIGSCLDVAAESRRMRPRSR